MDNYNFPVDLQPIYFGKHQKIDNRMAVIRTDTNTPLGIVSDNYGMVKHSTVIDSFRAAGKKYETKEKITLTNNGANLFYRMDFPKIEGEVRKNDLLRLQITVKNSYNGSNSLRIIFGALRLVCLNGMVIGQKFMAFAYRHIGEVGGMADADTIGKYEDAYKKYIKLFSETLPEIQAMSRAKIAKDGGLFDKKKIHIPGYLLEEAEASYKSTEDYTVWGYYNSLTYAITHKMKRESISQSMFYGMVAWKKSESLLG